MSKKVMGQQRTLLLILNTWRNTSFILKHLDVLHLISSSEQPLLREGISMRNTYTFMRKMYGKLPLGPFLFPSHGFPHTWFCFIFPCRAGLQRLISSFYPRCFSHSHLKIQIHPRPVITCAWQVQALWLSNGVVSRGWEEAPS